MTELHAGDIGAVAKLKDTLTGDTLGDKSSIDLVPRGQAARSPRSRSRSRPSRGKTKTAWATRSTRSWKRIQSLRFYRDPQTKEFLLAGDGQQHVEVIVSRLKKRYGVDVELKAPKIPYRETIRGTADVQGRHKKQTGGHGQFGDCWIRMEPLPRGGKFEFANEIFGGSIPEVLSRRSKRASSRRPNKGYLAGFPMVDFKVTVYDGSYHDVDSSELSFKLAARKAFKAAMQQAKPTLLEPIMNVEIQAPGGVSRAT